MPGTNLWHFVPVSSQRINEGVYIGKGSKTYQKYGIIKLGSLMVRKGNDGVSCLVATFSLKDSEPRMLDLKHFNRAANEFCKCFKSCGSKEAFIEMFDGKMSASDDPNPKRPKLMEVASHAARKRQQENVNDQQAEFNDSGMDKEISPYHQGHFVLPVKCLECPPEEWLVRNCSDTIVKQLKQEMLKNACTDVQPILCIVHLKDGEIFQANMKEGYKYFTIGGNHSRQALQELLSEKEELQNLRRLASKHNCAASHVHEMTTWDLIQQSRKLLYELSDIPLHQDPPTRKPEGWRKACSAVLAIEEVP
ncbi:uncharacterized protein [Dysidea avara]|uniref:uncharacterized protein isoform X2 n=1 Tax=Dysidea avara TaxID=196820 RepID=UPI00332118AF